MKRRSRERNGAVEMFHRPERARVIKPRRHGLVRSTHRYFSICPFESARIGGQHLQMQTSFQVGEIHIGSGDLFLIAGPCVIESEEHAMRMAEIIKGVTRSLGFPFIFKASYDKANRTSIRSFRGPGIKEGLRILKKIKNELQLPVLTDVHETADVGKVAEVADVLQIPAFLSRQTDLVVAAALSGRAGEHQEGAIRFAVGYAACSGEVPRCWKYSGVFDRARGKFRIQQSGR